MATLQQLDHRFLWHPFTQMDQWTETSPLVIERAAGCYLYDVDGRAYLDGVASLWANIHGHGHPAINAAISHQLSKVAHSTLLGLSNPPAIRLAEALVEHAPAGLSRVFYSDSGSAAVEIALKLAFQYWRQRGQPEKREFIHLENAYHGDTLGAMSVGGIELFHSIFSSLFVSNRSIPCPGRTPQDHEAKARSLAALRKLLKEQAHTVAALIVEPLVQGAAGILIHPSGFLAEAAKLCKEHDVLLIVDEVATGFGRTGTLFACEQEGVSPDLLCLAKGISGGYLPLAATLATDAIYDAFGETSPKSTFYHGHTYTGNPLACAAGVASLRLFHEEATLEHQPAKRDQLATLLAELDQLPWVRETRQCGLMAGVELAKPDGLAFDPSYRVGARVCAEMRTHNVILRPLGDVLVIMPPLSITCEQISDIAAAIAASVTQICPRHA